MWSPAGCLDTARQSRLESPSSRIGAPEGAACQATARSLSSSWALWLPKKSARAHWSRCNTVTANTPPSTSKGYAALSGLTAIASMGGCMDSCMTDEAVLAIRRLSFPTPTTLSPWFTVIYFRLTGLSSLMFTLLVHAPHLGADHA